MFGVYILVGTLCIYILYLLYFYSIFFIQIQNVFLEIVPTQIEQPLGVSVLSTVLFYTKKCVKADDKNGMNNKITRLIMTTKMIKIMIKINII